ncbi:hypothetical protein [Massilia timonae]|uniref:hypothetical protein n=1 Tax=Massilia timonae TaxID=47229 RepID=UPI002353E523|nr:hypothetical protein [Massilia timonae]
MNKIITRALVAVWVLVATIALARLILVRPDLFPKVPGSFSLWAIEVYGSTNGEELADLEALLALGFSFIVVLLLTLLCRFIWRRAGRSAAVAD